MTPIEQAEAWHAGSGCEWDFRDLIAAHGRIGRVVATPEVFILARQVRSDWPESLRNDPWSIAPAGNCWHVWLIAGDWRGWERFLPYPLPWVSMHRHGKLRVYRLDRFRRLEWRDHRPPAFYFPNGKQGGETKGPGTPGSGAEDG